MVSIVDLKLKFLVSCHSQIGLILTKNGQKQVILGLKWLKIRVSQTFWSLGDQPKRDLRNHVRPFVRPLVTQFLENRSLLFSETLQLVRACKRDKNVPSAFLKKITICPFWPKTVQNWSPNSTFWWFFNLYFDHFSYLSLLISHFNLAYLDLCKFALFDEPLQRGLVVQLYSCIFVQLYAYIIIQLQFYMYTVIQFIQLCSLYSYSFKQIMSVERPSTSRLLVKQAQQTYLIVDV